MTYDARHQAMREATLLEWAEGRQGIPRSSRTARPLQADAARDTPAATVSGSTVAAGRQWKQIADLLAARLEDHLTDCGDADTDGDQAALNVYRAAIRMGTGT